MYFLCILHQCVPAAASTATIGEGSSPVFTFADLHLEDGVGRQQNKVQRLGGLYLSPNFS